jgi:hypothetical protein
MRSVSLGGVVAGMIAVNLLGGSAMAATPPEARDVAAARTVIRAITRFDQTALRHEGAMTAAAKALVAQVHAGCAGGLPPSVINGTAQQQAVAFDLVFESAFDLSLDVVHPLGHAALTMAKSLDRVHFSKRAFTRGIHATAKIQRVLLAIRPSDLCGDVKAAAAGGFAADAPGTTAFLKSFESLISGSAQSIPNTLKKIRAYLVTTGDRAALTRLQTVDSRYQKFSTKLVTKWGAKLGSVLTGAPPAGGTGGFPTGPPTPSITRTAMTAAFAAL